MVAVRMMLVMMVTIPVSPIMFPVGVSAECVIIMSVSALVSLIAITIFVVVAFMIATLIDNYGRSDLDPDVYFCLSLRHRHKTNDNHQTGCCE
jgi:hypothetical protein